MSGSEIEPSQERWSVFNIFIYPRETDIHIFIHHSKKLKWDGAYEFMQRVQKRQLIQPLRERKGAKVMNYA